MEQVTQIGVTMQRMEGQEAQDYMNSLLMEVAGADTMEDAHRTLLGRPRVNEHREETANMHLRLSNPYADTQCRQPNATDTTARANTCEH